MAEAIGKPICELERLLPMSEVRLWKAYFEEKWNIHEKTDWYLARIALAVHETMGGVKGARVNEYLLKFKADSKTRLSPEAASELGKLWVRNLVGLSQRKRKPVKKPLIRKGKK